MLHLYILSIAFIGHTLFLLRKRTNESQETLIV